MRDCPSWVASSLKRAVADQPGAPHGQKDEGDREAPAQRPKVRPKNVPESDAEQGDGRQGHHRVDQRVKSA